MEHAAHQLRARLLQEDRQDGGAVSVHHLLALFGQGRRQLRAHFIQSVKYFFLNHNTRRSLLEENRLDRAGEDSQNTNMTRKPAHNKVLFPPQKAARPPPRGTRRWPAAVRIPRAGVQCRQGPSPPLLLVLPLGNGNTSILEMLIPRSCCCQ